MTSELFVADFEEALADLPGSGDVIKFRRDQMSRFRDSGLPTVRQEDWRYTSLADVSTGGFVQPKRAESDSPSAANEMASLALDIPQAYRIVFVDGFFDAGQSTLPTDAGLTVTSLRQALAEGIAPANLQLAGTGPVLAALNAAWMQDGALITVAKDAAVQSPIYLVFMSNSAARVAIQPRVILNVEARGQVSVIQHFVATQDAGGWLNSALDAVVAEQGQLTLTTLQEGAAAQVHTSTTRAVVGRDATLTLGSADFGASLARHEINVELSQPGGTVDMFGLFFPRDGQHMDIHTRIDHLAPQTNSCESYHGMAGERGRGVFNGKVVVHPNAQGIDARQSSKNLLLGERCEIDTKPELEIYADDVKCSHGATVGELDHDALFYLLSRGLPEDTAKALLTYAFANEIVDRMTPAALGEHVARTLLGAIPETGLTEELAEVLR